ncbi:MAG: hypothetical protein CSH36_10695 [Thalassolituus sp.]|nr:MAG: hypothetical protein CSH36_10695 [Thalassolituus sp.]
MLRLKSAALAVALAGISSGALAGDLMINGFMNVNAGITSTDDISSDGYDSDLSFANQTIAGLQLVKQVNDSTSATVQLVSRGADDYKTEASWVYFTYSVNENTDIRMGRLRTPTYHYSDFLEVGYAYNWITPSSLIYLPSALSSFNGIDLTHRFTLGGMDGYVQLYTGRFGGDLETGGDTYYLDLNPNRGAIFSLTSGDITGRISYHNAKLSLDLDPTAGRALDNLLAGATLASVGDEFTADESDTKYYQASFSYDNGSTSAIAEWTSLDHETAIFNDSVSYMIGGAQRFGMATVHLTYVATEDELESGVVGVLQKNAESKENSIILGVRYDYDSATAFKIEAERNDEELVGGAEGESGMIYRVGMALVF